MNAAAASPLVAVTLPAGDDWWAAVRDLWAGGSAVLPLDPAAPAAALRAAIAALRPTALLSSDGLQQLEGGVPVAAGTAAVVATSGSTGAPKGVELTHAALRASASASLARLGADATDRWLCCLPPQHVGGLQVLVRSALMGVAPVIHRGFDVHAVAAERQVTMVSLVPTMLRRLLDAGVELPHLRCILLGGAAPGPRLLADAREAGWPVVTTYGMTETAGGCVYDGQPLDGVEVAIGEDSRIRIRGPVLFSGYRRQPQLTQQAVVDGWLQTQDLGRWDGSVLEVLGRADDVIITGGHNVAASRIAGVLELHPRVAEAAVVGRRDREWGERIVAYIVPRGAPPLLSELRDHVAQTAPVYAAPRELVIVSELPRLANGKVDRLRLVESPPQPDQPEGGAR